MTIYRISTTAYDDEDFYVMTNLKKKQVIDAITPTVMRERDGGDMYDNEDLATAIKALHPNAEVSMFTSFETITI